MGVFGVVTLAVVTVGAMMAGEGWAARPIPSPIDNIPSIPSNANYNPTEECNNIRLKPPSQTNKVRGSILQKMCLTAAAHVGVTDKFKQFAMFLLHRDDFDEDPKWYSGDAEDVLNDKYWTVNDLKKLTSTKYNWYKHGLPMWPLPYQAMPNKTSRRRRFSIKKKLVNWPNYGFATPIYFASKAWRDQVWSAEEFFQQEKNQSPFQNHEAFQELVKEVVAGVNGSNVESYSEWPFLKHSLPLMTRSMVDRNKGVCPDELYIYLRISPVQPEGKTHWLQPDFDARNILTTVNCRSTEVILGYSKEYNEREDIMPI